MLLGYIVVAIWLYLLLGRGWFWRVREEPPPVLMRTGVRVAAVIPARNEAEVIGEAVRSLPSWLRIFVVDDHSSDATAEVAQREGAIVIQADPLPPGWTGKLWAVECGLRVALQESPDYVLLTDADIVHAADNVRQLVARAEAGCFDLVSLMARLRCESLAERALIPAFLFFFLKLFPPSWRVGAAGGCMLIRPSALERIGGIQKIRGELIDDCALAREIRRGGRIWMGVTTRTYSIRRYETFGEIGRMISRTAFTQLRHSGLLLFGTVAAMLLTYVIPPVLAIVGRSWLGAMAWALMTIAYLPTLRLYRRSPVWALALTAVAVFYTGATIASAVQYWTGRGGLWKGRVQDQARC